MAREHPVASVPPVAALVRVHVPLAVVGVPVHVHDVGALSYPRPSIPPSLEYSNILRIVFYSGPKSPLISDTN